MKMRPVDMLNNLKGWVMWPQSYHLSQDEAETCIEALREMTLRWIPVGEELPPKGQKVLVTAYGRVCFAELTSTDGNMGYPVFRLQDGLSHKPICETVSHGPYSQGRIDAWMPLPDPYRV